MRALFLYWLTVLLLLGGVGEASKDKCNCCEFCAFCGGGEGQCVKRGGSKRDDVQVETLSEKQITKDVIGQNRQWLLMCQDHSALSSGESFSKVLKRMKEVVRILTLDNADENLQLGLAECNNAELYPRSAQNKNGRLYESLLQRFNLPPTTMGILFAGGERPAAVTQKLFKSAVDLAYFAKSAVRPRVEKLVGDKATTARLKSKCTFNKECFLIYSNRTLSKEETKTVLDLKRSRRSAHWAFVNATTHRLSLEDLLPSVPGASSKEPRLIAFRSKKAKNKDDTKVSAVAMAEEFSSSSVKSFVGKVWETKGKLSKYGGSPTLLRRRKPKPKETKPKTSKSKKTSKSRSKQAKSSQKQKPKSKKQREADKKLEKERRAREAQRRAEMEAEAEQFMPQSVSEEELEDLHEEEDVDLEQEDEYGRDEDDDDDFIDLDEEE